MKKPKPKDFKDFDDWFKKQFGSLPLAPEALSNLRGEIASKRAALEELECFLRYAETIQAQYTATLYARNATLKGN